MINVSIADEILKLNKCGDLFSNDANKAKDEYRRLAKLWHPDLNKDQKASDVIAKINTLYGQATDLITSGKWERSNYIRIISEKREIIEESYLSHKTFELGDSYICDDKIVYLLSNDYRNFYDNSLLQIKALRYANKDMEELMSKVLPSIIKSFKTDDEKYCLILNKPEDVFSLSDTLNHYKGAIPDRHVAWIMSRLNGISCYLDYLGVAHNGINIDNCFICPKHHTISLLGGWWYTQKQGDKLIGTSKDIFEIMPIPVKTSKLSNIATDLESIKLIGRQLLGDKFGTKLSTNKDYPKAFIEWLRKGSSNKALTEMKSWEESLTKAYGQRKFIVMDISKNDIYKN